MMSRGVAMSEMILGNRLRNMRGTRTLEEIASSVGIAKTTLHGYESGRREPDLSTLQKLARALNTSMSYLLGETDNPAPPPKLSAANEGVEPGTPQTPESQLIIERAVRNTLLELEKWKKEREKRDNQDS